LKIERNALSRLLASITKAVEARQTIPILGTVRLLAAGNMLTATATNLDVEITASAPCEGDIAVCVDAKLIEGIAKKLPADATIEFTHSNDVLTVKAGRSRFTLQVLPIEDFPEFNQSNYTAEFEYDLAALFAPVKFAISTEETRYYLNGIFLHVDDGKLVAVATDGHRLGRNIGNEVPEIPAIIVPRKMVDLTISGIISVAISDTRIRFTGNGTTITSKLIDGTFPDYKRILPTGNDKIINFDSAALRAAVERVSVVSSERGRAVKLSFANDQVTLAVNSPENGSAAEDVVVSYAKDEIEIGFNNAYLSELIGQFPAGELRLALADGGAPALFTSEKADGLLMVLMPMRT